MTTEISILILEDDPFDAELEIAKLEEAGFICRWKRIESRVDFLAQLESPDYDLILADYNLPAFDGLTALEKFLEHDLNLPFILVSGTVGEETAVESLRAGATDYVLKDRLSRLGPVVQRALRERDEQIQRQQAEQALHQSLQEIAHTQRFLLALSQAAQAVQRAHTPLEIYDTIGREVVELGYHSAIFALTEDGRYLTAIYLTNESVIEEAVGRLAGFSIWEQHFPLDTVTVFDQIVVDEKSVYMELDDIELPGNNFQNYRILIKELVGLLGINQLIGAPMRIGNGLFGLLFIYGDGLRQSDVSAVSIFANAVATALENARLGEENRRQTQQLQEILDTLPEGVLLLDADYRIQLMNPIGQLLVASLSEAKMGDVLTNLGDYQLAPLLELTTNNPWQELKMPDRRKTFELAIQSLESGPQAGGWVLLLRDVSEERELLEYQQVQERLATVGQLAAGVAHDLNNIMAVITLYSQLILRTTDISSKNHDRLVTMHTQANRASHLINQILDFSRRSVMERSSLKFLPLLKELLGLLERTLPENIRVNFNYEPGDYTVNADPTRLQQVIMNLSVNARDAMPEGGTLAINLSHFKLLAGQKRPLPDMAPGNWIKIIFNDTGMGVESQNLAHIFEPFFTTKPPGQGTGLGLAQVYGIVRQHGGHITVSSQMDQGTTFTIFLPALQFPNTAPLDPHVGATLPSWGQGETILVVEDNGATRAAVCETLEELGYKTLAAANGEEALVLFADQRSDIALVLSDLVMPVMGGDALFKVLSEKDPNLRMIIITGYPLEEEGKELLELGLVAWLPKPVSGQDIAQIIAEALGKTN